MPKSWPGHKRVRWQAIPRPLWPLLVYLAAVLIIGKGPTYLRIGPVYWGEAVTAMAVLWAAYSAPRWTPCRRGLTGLSLLIFLFMALGALSTLRSLFFWPMLDVLRDAAIWYYCVFYFVGIAVAQQFDYGDRFWRMLRTFWLVALVWGVCNWLSGERLSAMGPLTPGRAWPVLANSGSELYQNVGLGAFVVLTGRGHSGLVRDNALRIFALLGVVCAMVAPGRGVRLGLAVAVLTVFATSFGRGYRALQKRLAALAITAVLASVFLGVAYGPQFAQITHLDRFSPETAQEAGDTLTWRWVWWQRLTDEVLAADPILGLGFGRSLAVYNVFITGDDFNWPVRSPHNFNMTVFARMGLLGLAIWGAILLLGPGALVARAWRNGGLLRNTYSPEQRTELLILLIMLIASFVNASFGVLLEGPVLAIPFWFLLGFATARSLRTASPVLCTSERARRPAKAWSPSPS